MRPLVEAHGGRPGARPELNRDRRRAGGPDLPSGTPQRRPGDGPQPRPRPRPRRASGRASPGFRGLRRRAEHTGAHDDSGSAVVEFLAAALLLLLPVLYLVVVLGRLQAATFAAEGAAREAGRSFTTSSTVAGAMQRATASVRIALDDQGFTDVDAATALAVSCSTTPCLEPGSDVRVRVSFEVPLPAVPSFVQSAVPLAIPVTAEHVAPVDSFLVTP